MAKVICKLPNASEEISGVKFKAHPDGAGMVSEDISDEQAAHFASIPGYELVGVKKAAAPAGKSVDELEQERQEEEARQTAAAELENLRARAKELGVEVKGNWKADRLRAEIEKAEKDKVSAEGEDQDKPGAEGGGEQQ